MVNDIYEWLIEMDHILPDIPSFEILKENLPRICPESIIDPEATEYFRLESAIKAYGLGALDLSSNMFNMLESVRAADSLYEQLDNFKREQIAKQANKGK